MHNPQGDGEGEPQPGVVERPAGPRLDAAQAVGERVAMDAERRGRLRQVRMEERRLQRLQATPPRLRPTDKERLEEAARVAKPVPAATSTFSLNWIRRHRSIYSLMLA